MSLSLSLRTKVEKYKELCTQWQRGLAFVPIIVMSKAYGLSAGCSQAPNSPYWIVDPDFAPDATESSLIGSVPLLKRRGVACLASDRDGTRGP